MPISYIPPSASLCLLFFSKPRCPAPPRTDGYSLKPPSLRWSTATATASATVTVTTVGLLSLPPLLADQSCRSVSRRYDNNSWTACLSQQAFSCPPVAAAHPAGDITSHDYCSCIRSLLICPCGTFSWHNPGPGRRHTAVWSGGAWKCLFWLLTGKTGLCSERTGAFCGGGSGGGGLLWTPVDSCGR